MGKISINASIVSDSENTITKTSGIKTENKITYKEDNILVTIQLSKNKINMVRDCNEYKINLNFEKGSSTISTYQVFGGSKTFELETITKKLIIEDNKIQIDYILEGNTFHYVLEMEDL